MAKAKKITIKKGLDEWMGTYSDCVTLLFCFFVLLYAASSPDEVKFQYLMQAFAQSGDYINPVVTAEPSESKTQGDTGNADSPPEVSEDTQGTGQEVQSFDDLFNWVSAVAESADISESVSVSEGAGRIYIHFDDDIMFEPNSAVLTTAGKDALRRFFPGIKVVKKYVQQVIVSGHTAQGVSPVSDWQLSSGRAAAVTDYMDYFSVVESAKFLPEGHGPYRPLYAADSPDAGKNRRVELVIIRNEIEPDDTPIVKDILKYDYNLTNDNTDNVTGEPVAGDTNRDKLESVLDNIRDHYAIGASPVGIPSGNTAGPDVPGGIDINESDLYPVDAEGKPIVPDAAAGTGAESSETPPSADETAASE